MTVISATVNNCWIYMLEFSRFTQIPMIFLSSHLNHGPRPRSADLMIGWAILCFSGLVSGDNKSSPALEKSQLFEGHWRFYDTMIRFSDRLRAQRKPMWREFRVDQRWGFSAMKGSRSSGLAGDSCAAHPKSSWGCTTPIPWTQPKFLGIFPLEAMTFATFLARHE